MNRHTRNTMVPGQLYLLARDSEGEHPGAGPLVWFGADGVLYNADAEPGDDYSVTWQWDYAIEQVGAFSQEFAA